MELLKRCSCCKVPMVLSLFPKNKSKKDGYDCYCSSCKNAKRKEWDRSDISKRNSKIRRRKSKLKLEYDLTVEEYSAMFNIQEGKCPICNRHQDELRKALCVDHDHITGRIRGLLCTKCNLRLGTFNDNIEDLKTAIVYLEKYK